mmetsp:Transcript_79330/g.199309  ORF Transcript_79330/g.199309 Transcript_79330/m.199309 type:complete len:203 (+) Transcript_79330:242-850(+)
MRTSTSTASATSLRMSNCNSALSQLSSGVAGESRAWPPRETFTRSMLHSEARAGRPCASSAKRRVRKGVPTLTPAAAASRKNHFSSAGAPQQPRNDGAAGSSPCKSASEANSRCVMAANSCRASPSRSIDSKRGARRTSQRQVRRPRKMEGVSAAFCVFCDCCAVIVRAKFRKQRRTSRSAERGREGLGIRYVVNEGVMGRL